jgi:hypothetical protein
LLPSQRDGLGAIPGLAHDGNVVFDAQDGLEPGPDE